MAQRPRPYQNPQRREIFQEPVGFSDRNSRSESGNSSIRQVVDEEIHFVEDENQNQNQNQRKRTNIFDENQRRRTNVRPIRPSTSQRIVQEEIQMATFPNPNLNSNPESVIDDMEDRTSEDDKIEEEENRKAELRSRIEKLGGRKCWAKYCWADKENADCHSHPLETLSSNRLKLMGKGETDQLIRTGRGYRLVRIIRYNGDRFIRSVDFYGPIYRRIEGYHGSGVAGYVGLLNRLLLLSFYTFLLVGGLFVAPSMVNFSRFSNGIAKYASQENILEDSAKQKIWDSFAEVFNMSGRVETYYLLTHSSINRPNSELTWTEELIKTAVELLDGTGWMEASWMFLGQYADRIDLVSRSNVINNSTVIQMDPFPYNLPLAFLCSIFGVIIVSLVVLIFSSGTSLKENLKGQHSRAYPFCDVLFSSWPHSLQSQTGVGNQKLTETSQFKILLTEAAKPQRHKKNDVTTSTQTITTMEKKTTLQLVLMYMVRTIVWLLVGGLLAAFAYLLYSSIVIWVPELLKGLETGSNTTASKDALSLLYNFIPSIIITAFNIFIPMLLEKVAKFEAYVPVKVELRVTLVRTVLLRLASVAVLLFSIFLQLESKTDLPSSNSASNSTFGLVIKNITKTPCFETYVGQQIYKVLVLDMIVSIGIFIGLRIPAKLMYKATNYKWLRAEFDLPGNILSAIYIQCLYWLGIFYAPLLSAMAILHFLLKAIIGQLGIFYVFAPPSKIHHSSGSDVFFTIVALLSFFLALIVLGFAILKVQPSTVCGPFIFMQNYSTMYDFFMGTIIGYAGNFKFLIEIGTSSVILFPVTIFIAVILYYKIATASAKATGIKILKKKIADATGQKKFLERKARQVNLKL